MLDNYVGFPDGSVQLKNSIVIPVNNIDTDQIKNGAITTGKINNGAVSHDKIANNAVETNNIKDSAITADKIAEGAIPSPLHNYSTTEQVVGTWIDGKPIYEKTFTGISITTNNPLELVDLSTVYAETIIDVSFYVVGVDNESFGQNYRISRDSWYNVYKSTSAGSKKIYLLRNDGGDWAPRSNCVLVVRYTKTTDTATNE